MTAKNGAYFQRRVQFHLAKAMGAEPGVAVVHRHFAQLYSDKAAQTTRLPSDNGLRHPSGGTIAPPLLRH